MSDSPLASPVSSANSGPEQGPEQRSDLRSDRAVLDQSSGIPLGVAPMDGVTDFATRVWLNLTSRPDFGITPFFRVTPDYPLNKLPATFCPDPQLNTTPHVRPQLMGSCPKSLARVARHLLQSHEKVDLNLGCPAPTVVGHNGGSALIRCTDRLREFLDQYFAEVPAGSTSIKTRLGFDAPSEASGLMKVFADYPLASLTLHGRTRHQRYTGRADWSEINRCAQALPFPITASGDVVSSESFESFRNSCPHAHSLIIGRGLLRNPWLLHEIRNRSGVTLAPEVLVSSLQVFAQLHSVLHDPEWAPQLPRLPWNEMIPPTPPESPESPSSERGWRDLHALLENMLKENPSPDSPSSGPMAKRTLSRLKMLWNYLRTSLPDAFGAPGILRAQSLTGFFDELQILIDHSQKSSHTEDGRDPRDPTDVIVIRHNPQMDWRFSGESREQEKAP